MMKRVVTSEPGKYVLAGGLAFICDISILYLCTEFLGFHYLVSNVFGYAAGLSVSYFLNIKWVFSYRRYQNAALEFTIFNLIIIAGLGLSEVLMYLIVDRFGFYYLYAKVIASAAVFLFNYIAKKFLLFHPYSSNQS